MPDERTYCELVEVVERKIMKLNELAPDIRLHMTGRPAEDVSLEDWRTIKSVNQHLENAIFQCCYVLSQNYSARKNKSVRHSR